jgi:membrane protein YqaA with SNARE-associated domain
LTQEPLLTESTAPGAPLAAGKRSWVRRLYDWVLSWADSPYGTRALFGISFAESSFFPIPPDVLQIALSVSKPKRSYWYAAVSTVASVLGGILGWYIGSALWHHVSEFFFAYVPGFTHENYALVEQRYRAHAFLAIFTAAFTPIPYKIFTISAGVFGVALPVLVVASLLGRAGRFFAVGTVLYFFGPKAKEWLEKYFELATLVLLALGVGGFVAVKYLL